MIKHIRSRAFIKETTRKELNNGMSPDPKRAKELRDAREAGVEGIAKRIWPKLNLIMTADSGTFELYGDRLRSIYCQSVPLYSPLYAASEGLLGVNIWPDERPSRYLLAPNSMVFEFIPIERCEEDQPNTVFMDQVHGGTGSVICKVVVDISTLLLTQE